MSADSNKILPMTKSESVGSLVRTIQISIRYEGQRLDNFLFRELKGVPRSRIYRLIRRGEVRLNKKRCKPDYKLSVGDRIRVPPVRISSKTKGPRTSPALTELLLSRILYETDDFLVLNKPPGFSVQGGENVQFNLIDALRASKPEWKVLELVHRLDRDTSGCLLLSKNLLFHRALQEQFKLKTIKKTYHAIVHGCWPAGLKLVDAALLKSELKSGERVVKVEKSGKPSKTEFKVIKQYQKAAYIEARPITGRTHQIRVHCQYAGCPIAGDLKYGPKNKSSELHPTKKLCLHAARLRFLDPTSQQQLEISAPLDKYFQKYLDKII